jgi:hypothetical protein
MALIKIKVNRKVTVTTSTEVEVDFPLFYHDSCYGDESSSDTYGIVSGYVQKEIYFFDDWRRSNENVKVSVNAIRDNHQFSCLLNHKVDKSKYDEALNKALEILRGVG